MIFKRLVISLYTPQIINEPYKCKFLHAFTNSFDLMNMYASESQIASESSINSPYDCSVVTSYSLSNFFVFTTMA